MYCIYCRNNEAIYGAYCRNCGKLQQRGPNSGAIFCAYCRADNPGDALFCWNCGNQFQREANRSTSDRIIWPGMPLPGALISESQPFGGNVPMVQGTPQAGSVPLVQGTPSPLSNPLNPPISQGAALSSPPHIAPPKEYPQPPTSHPGQPPIQHPVQPPVHPEPPPIQHPGQPPVQHPEPPPIQHPGQPPVDHPEPRPIHHPHPGQPPVHHPGQPPIQHPHPGQPPVHHPGQPPLHYPEPSPVHHKGEPSPEHFHHHHPTHQHLEQVSRPQTSTIAKHAVRGGARVAGGLSRRAVLALIVGGAATVAVGATAAIVLTSSSPDKPVSAYCNAIKNGDAQTAYNQLSSRLQAQINEQQFANQVQAVASIKPISDCSTNNVRQNGTTATVTLKVTLFGISLFPLTFDVKVIQENGVWKLDDATLLSL